MDINEAIDVLAAHTAPEKMRKDAAVTVRRAFTETYTRLTTLQHEHNALKRVMYLLVQSHPDEELREEMNATYTKVSSGLASPEE